MEDMLLFEQFELDNLKADHAYECALDQFAISAMQLNSLIKEGYYSEASEDSNEEHKNIAKKFLDSVKNWFDDLIERIKKLVTDFIIEIKAKQRAKDINKKLDTVKKIWASNKSMLVNKKVKGVDTAKYYRQYTKYINEWVSGVGKLYSKNYDNYEDFEKACNEFDKKMDSLINELNLIDDEPYLLDYNLNSMIQYTEKELASQESIAKAYRQKWIDAVNVTKKASENQKDTRIVNASKSIASKLTSVCSNGLKKIITNKNIMTVLGAIAGASVGNALVRTAPESNTKSYDGKDGKKITETEFYYDNYITNRTNKALGNAEGALVGAAIGRKIAKAADKKLNKNVDTDQTTKKNIDNDNKSDQKN